MGIAQLNMKGSGLCMKKRMLCIVMVFVLIGLTVMVWPVSAEPVNQEAWAVDAAEEAVAASTNSFTLS